MGHNCLHVRFFLLDLDSDLDLRSVDLDLDLPSLKRTWTRTWTCSLKVDLDLGFTVAGLVTSLVVIPQKKQCRHGVTYVTSREWFLSEIGLS